MKHRSLRWPTAFDFRDARSAARARLETLGTHARHRPALEAHPRVARWGSLAFGPLYLAFGVLSFLLCGYIHGGGFVWSGVGLGLAAFLLLPARHWGVLAAGIAASLVVLGIGFGFPWHKTLAHALGQSMGPLAGAIVVSRFCEGRRTLDRTCDVIALMAGIATASILVGLFGMVGAAGGPPVPLTPVTQGMRWMTSSAVGALLFAPLILALAGYLTGPAERRLKGVDALGIALLAALALFVFAWPARPLVEATPPANSYLLIPLFLWLAFRARVLGSALAITIAGTIALCALFMALADVAPSPARGSAIVQTQFYVSVMAIMLLLLTAALAARDRMQAERERVARRLAALGRFARDVAHDFNNIVGGMRAHAELATESLDRVPQPRDVRRHLEAICEGAERSKQLSSQILEFTRRSDHAGNDPVALGPLLNEVVQLLAPTSSPAVAVKVHTLADARVIADDGDLIRIFVNLLVNAIAATRRGRIDIQIDRVVLHRAHVTRTGKLTSGLYAAVTIRDSGCGLAPKHAGALLATAPEHAFATTNGVGLSIVGTILRTYRGGIEVHATPEEGSSVRILLPEASQPLALGAAAKVVLVMVEDRLERELMEERIASLGYEPVGYERPADALEAIGREPEQFDALVVEDGASDTIARVIARARTARADLPVVVIERRPEPERIRRMEQLPDTLVLKDPVSADALEVALTTIFAVR